MKTFMLLLEVVGLVATTNLVQATIQDVPGLNGIVPDVSGSNYKFGKKRPSDFVHPGLWHTHEDLERIRNNVMNGTDPWKSAFDRFSVEEHSLSNYSMQGPEAIISRGNPSNYTSFTSDTRAAWQNALMWYITRDQGHWDTATTILDAWGSNLTNVIGIDRSLMIGLEGSLFANAAEIMRWEGNWTEAGATYLGGKGFSVQLYWLFARQSLIIGQANYGLISIKGLLDFAVYLDDVAMYNYAINAYQNDLCAGLSSFFHPETGQSSESGRDQGHTTSGIGWLGLAARTAQSQGADLYGLNDNLLLLGAEYSAKFNLNHSVEYDPSWYRCEAVLVDGPWPEISNHSKGIANNGPVWDIIYYEYAVKRGLHAPYTSQAKKEYGFEGTQKISSDDLPSWGDLLWAN